MQHKNMPYRFRETSLMTQANTAPYWCKTNYLHVFIHFPHFPHCQSGPPVIIIAPEDTTMNMSQDAVLQCQAEAYPSNLTYEWWKQGENVHHIE